MKSAQAPHSAQDSISTAMSSKKIMISGGHLTPALAFIDYIKDHALPATIVFVGREFSQDRLKQRAREQEEVERRQIRFITFQAARLNSGSLVHHLRQLALFVKSFFAALVILRRERPDVFLSFGGYLAVPLAIAAWVLRIPIVTHEQTRTGGHATDLIARIARVVAVSHPESLEKFPKEKVILTGNLVRSTLLQPQTQPSWLTIALDKPLIYITGGNQGSQTLNTAVMQLLPTVLKQYCIIHQCGNPTSTHNYREELLQAAQQLPAQYQKRYVVREWLHEGELAWMYTHAHLVVSRAGANTIQELILFRVPSVLIPLPISHRDEQLVNARTLADEGGAQVVLQRDLSSATLLDAIERVSHMHQLYRQNLEHIPIITDADAQLYQAVAAIA